MNAIIIEDEYLAAAELERLLGEVAPEITILTKLDSVRGSDFYGYSSGGRAEL